MLKERAAYYYFDQGKSCAEAILLAANEAYSLNLTEGEIQLFAGFRTGMGRGSTCGGLAGAMGVLSRMFGQRPDFKELCGKFVTAFEETLGSLDCSLLEARYKTPERRCTAAVELSAQVLEDFILAHTIPKDETCTLTPEDIKRVKGLGFLQHKGTNRFNARVITRNGRITAGEAAAIAEAAKLYGDGYMMMTTRMTVEVSGIHYDHIDAFMAHLAQHGLEVGGTGSKVRPVVSCKGTTCQYGLIDTYALSEKIHYAFYKGYRSVTLPHKFKIGVGGCPNNCVKPDLNDLGIIGAKVPHYDPQLCKGCKVCQVEAACPIQIAKMENGKLALDTDDCNNCGRCLGKCPFHCIDASANGYRVYIGGRWGKKVARGRMIRKLYTSEAEVMEAVEKAILLFRDQGIPGERFGDTIARIGFEQAEALMLGDELLRRKNEILGITVTGGASC